MTFAFDPPPGVNSSDALTGVDQRYRKFTDLVRREIGVKLDDGKRSMVETRLRRRITALGLPSFDAYLRHLFDDKAFDEERDAIFNAVTTNKTDFYREPAHYDHMRAHALSDAVRYRRASGGTVKIWSAAASTGAEAWTAAFVAADYGVQHGMFRWAILGTDVNTEVLHTARTAVYADDLLAPVPTATRKRWLVSGADKYAGQSRVVPELRKRVGFFRFNLLAGEKLRDHDIDIAFLRNVLIYFTPDDQRRAIQTVVSHIRPGGILYLGHSETMNVSHPQLKQVAPSTYLKTH